MSESEGGPQETMIDSGNQQKFKIFESNSVNSITLQKSKQSKKYNFGLETKVKIKNAFLTSVYFNGKFKTFLILQ